MRKNKKRRLRPKRERQTRTTKTQWTMTTSISKPWWCERNHEATPDNNKQFLRHQSSKKVNLWIWIDFNRFKMICRYFDCFYRF
jgi:hypothetical protein